MMPERCRHCVSLPMEVVYAFRESRRERKQRCLSSDVLPSTQSRFDASLPVHLRKLYLCTAPARRYLPITTLRSALCHGDQASPRSKAARSSSAASATVRCDARPVYAMQPIAKFFTIAGAIFMQPGMVANLVLRVHCSRVPSPLPAQCA